MSVYDDFSYSAADFSGRTRLFPLPNLVLFPHVMQPLHVFEPRYRDLLREALAEDRLISMAVLQPGWEKDYEGRPPVYPVACLGRIAAHHELPNGSSNLLLCGLYRVRLLGELPPAKRFREAKARVCEDVTPPEDAVHGPVLLRQLRDAFFRLLPRLPQAQEQWQQVLGGNLSLGALTDIISYLLDIDLAEKYSLLAEPNVRRRAERLLEHLAAMSSSRADDFLPEFSAN